MINSFKIKTIKNSIFLIVSFLVSTSVQSQNQTDIQKLLDSAKLEKDKSHLIEATNILRIVIEKSEKLEYKKEVIEASLLMGNIYLQMGDRTTAYQYNMKALKISELEGFDKELGKCFMNLGRMYEDEDNMEQTMKLYKQAKEIFEKQQDSININVINIRLGNFLLSSKRFPDASVEYRKALLFAKKMNNIRQISNIYNNLGITYMELNHLDSAFYYIEESHKINMTLGIVDRKPAYLHNIGKCYYKKNNFEQAILYADSSFYMGKQNLNLMIQRDALKLLREIYQSKKNYEKALEYALLFSETDKKVFDEEKLKKIQQIYTLYEIEKRNHQIELLELKKKKQQTLTYYLIGIIGLIICVFIIFYQKQKRDKLTLLMKNELQNMQTRLEKAEKEKVEAKFLRMQISPHFLFNTLNNLFSLAIKNDDQITASGISKLSNLTRYLLYQSKQEEVSLESEIFIIENYIGLQNLRINEKDDVEIIFTQDIEDIETYYIAPNILITFVENAFKYGILPQKKSQIIIKMSSINDMMCFMVQNTKHSNLHPAKETSMSIGLDNAKKQLEKLYPNQYHLEIENEIHFFRIQLQIRLHKTDI